MSASVGTEYERPKVSLSCLQCQNRKKKCDKQVPCQACRQAGISCTAVSRTLLPRGRHATQREGGDLRQRVARLEQLLSSQRSASDPVSLTPPADQSKSPDSSWTSISEEVVGIRQLLDNLAGDEPSEPLETPNTDRPQSFDILLYSDASCFVHPHVLESPPAAMASELLEIYLHRVDRVFKAIHAPSLRTIILGNITITPAQEALKFAVFFTAVNTLDEQECLERFNSTKAVLGNKFQLATEVFLSRAGLMITTNLTALQAFVIYLAGLRAFKGFRAVSNLLATAVRIGQSLGLDREATSHTPFETELRRRTWYSISILDVQAAFDSGSYSALANGVYFKGTPLHINDADILPDDLVSASIRYTFTDMTFSSAAYEMLRHMRKMIHVPVDADGQPLAHQNWTQRHFIVGDCARTLREGYLKYCDPADTFQCFTRVVCEAMITTLRLLVRRPMYRFYSDGPPPKNEFGVLDVARDILDQTLQKVDNSRFKPWEWFVWVKWYALAVLLAELCEHTEGPLVDRAWVTAEASFAKYQGTIKDAALWSSIKNLMHRARSARSLKNVVAVEASGSISTIDNPLPFQGPVTVALDADSQITGVDSYGSSSEQANLWEETEMLSWVTWESFVQELGDPVQLNAMNGYY